MAPHYQPHAHVPFGTAMTSTSVDELIRPSLRRAFPLPSWDDASEAKFRLLLDALAQQ